MGLPCVHQGWAQGAQGGWRELSTLQAGWQHSPGRVLKPVTQGCQIFHLRKPCDKVKGTPSGIVPSPLPAPSSALCPVDFLTTTTGLPLGVPRAIEARPQAQVWEHPPLEHVAPPSHPPPLFQVQILDLPLGTQPPGKQDPGNQLGLALSVFSSLGSQSIKSADIVTS